MEEQISTFSIPQLQAYIKDGYQINYAINKQNVLYIIIHNNKVQILCIIDIILQQFEQLNLPVCPDETIEHIYVSIDSQTIIVATQNGKVIFYQKQNDTYLHAQVQLGSKVVTIILDPHENNNIFLCTNQGQIHVVQLNITKKKLHIEIQINKPLCNLQQTLFNIEYYSFEVEDVLQQMLSAIRQQKQQNLITLNKIPQYQEANRNIRCYIILLNLQTEVKILQTFAMYLSDALSQLQNLINLNQHYIYKKEGIISQNQFTQCSFIRKNEVLSGFSLIYIEKHIQYREIVLEQHEVGQDEWEDIGEIQCNDNQLMNLFGQCIESESYITQIIQCTFPMDLIQLHNAQFGEDIQQLDINKQYEILLQHNEVFNNIFNAMLSKCTRLPTQELEYQVNKPIFIHQIDQILFLLYQKHILTINTQNPETSKTHQIQNNLQPVALCQFSNSILVFGKREIQQIFIEDYAHLFSLLQNENYDQLIMSIKNINLPSEIIVHLFNKIDQQNTKKAMLFLANSGLDFYQQCLYLVQNSKKSEYLLNKLQQLIYYNYQVLDKSKGLEKSLIDSLDLINMQFKSILISYNKKQLEQANYKDTDQDNREKDKLIFNLNNIVTTLIGISSKQKTTIIHNALKMLLQSVSSQLAIFPWIKIMLSYLDKQDKFIILNHLAKMSKDKELFLELMKQEAQNDQENIYLQEISRFLQPNEYLYQLISNGVINETNVSNILVKICIYQGQEIILDVINQNIQKFQSLKYYFMLLSSKNNDQMRLLDFFNKQIKYDSTDNSLSYLDFKYLQFLLLKCNQKVENVIELFVKIHQPFAAFQLALISKNYEKYINIYAQHQLHKDKLIQLQLLISLLRSSIYNIEQVVTIVYKDQKIFDFKIINAIDKYLQLNLQWQQHVDFLKLQYHTTNSNMNKIQASIQQHQVKSRNNSYQIQCRLPVYCSSCKGILKKEAAVFRCSHTLCSKCYEQFSSEQCRQNSPKQCPFCSTDNLLTIL